MKFDMKNLKYTFIFTLFLGTFQFFAQSNITYDASTQVDVGAGADVCADAVNINGTWSGTGTICQGALPVSLSSFTYCADKRNVTLIWITEWELNNSGFDIERATPLNPPEGGTSEWKKIAFIPGHGTSNVSNGYMFKDEKLKAGTYKYRLKQIDYNGNYEYYPLEQNVTVNPPVKFDMGQNYPNPGNPKCKINFEMPVNGKVTIKLYDITGQEVFTLLNDVRDADYYTVEFDGSNIASGVYFYRIIASGEGQSFNKTMKMVIVK